MPRGPLSPIARETQSINAHPDYLTARTVAVRLGISHARVCLIAKTRGIGYRLDSGARLFRESDLPLFDPRTPTARQAYKGEK